MDNQKTIHDPAKVKLAPYFPDTPTFRYTHARYLDRIQTIDQQIGAVVKNLEEDGLLEDTFVFYFGDHGGVLPRGKGYAYESGLHVPLVVRIPENFKHLTDHKRGTRTDGFVSFIDFGPTVLNLAGIKANPLCDGKAFLGKGTSIEELATRNETFGYADRFDEKYDLVRFLRDLLTPGEIRTLAERWRVARLLDEGGHSYREISEMTGASTTTVTRVARFLSQEPWLGYRSVLDRLKEADQ